MTREGNQSATLHNRSWERIIGMLRERDHPAANALANTIDMQLLDTDPGGVFGTDHQNCIALSGLPGAGKSYVADRLAELYDTEVVSMGDAIRAEYEHRYNFDYDSNDLANFAAVWRDEAAHEIPEKVAELCRETGESLVIIDGVRSVTDYTVLSDAFNHFDLVEVQAPFYTRLNRLTNRGREGEEDFTAVDLAERDEHERQELGRKALLTRFNEDHTLKNSGVSIKQNLDRLTTDLDCPVDPTVPA